MVPGTFGVIGISVNTSSPTGLVCLFNPGSLATGCLVYLTDTATGIIYCRVVGRSLDTPVNTSLCPYLRYNGPLSTGNYSVMVYTIESDGSVSLVPAITEVVVDIFGPSSMSPGTCLSDVHVSNVVFFFRTFFNSKDVSIFTFTAR